MKILIVQNGFLGDTILSTPVIAGVKKIYPQSEVWMMTTPLSKDLVKRDPLLAGVIAFDKRGFDSGLAGIFRKSREIRSMGFDLVFCLHRSARTAILLALTGISRRVGFKTARLRFLFTETVPRLGDHDVLRNLCILRTHASETSMEEDMRLYESDVSELSADTQKAFTECGRDYIVLCPGSVWKTKRWYWKNYREVAQYYLNLGKKVVLLGSAAEVGLSEKVADGLPVINLVGKTNVSETMLFVKHAGLLICNDSMMLHMGSAFKVPNVAIFCATSPAFGFGPWKNPKALVVQKEGLKCKPCRRHGGHTCPTGTESCMKDLPASEVIRAAKNLVVV